MKELHLLYGDKVQFLLVYIREAHALDSPWPMLNGPLVEDPVSDGERHEVAGTWVQDLGLDMIPAVIDKIDDRVNLSYAAHPDRLYLVGEDGRIAHAGGRGPFGFAPDEFRAAVENEFAEPVPTPPERRM